MAYARRTRQAEYFSTVHDNVVAKLADVYASTVSTLVAAYHGIGRAPSPQRPEERQ